MRIGVRGLSRGLLACLACAAGLLVAGCTASLPPPPAAVAPLAGPSDTYRIGPLDTLEIFVWDTKNTSTSVPVRPDGRISFPLVGDIQAMGQTPTELAQAIQAALKPYVQEPVVTVVVSNFGDTAGQTIRVVGEAQHPAAVPYRAGMTVLDVMVGVGGLTPYAAGNRAVLVRGKTGTIYGLRLADLLDGGDLAANAPVSPGDVVLIPQSLI
jgi:polysaccharide export outer membrane protein